MTYANAQDVADELGRPAFDGDQIKQVNAWLKRTELLIRSRIPDLTEKVGDGTIDVDAVVSVEAAVVARKVLNPKGLRTALKSLDDASVQETTDTKFSDGVLRLTDEEWDMLLPAAARSAFSAITKAEPVRNTWPTDDLGCAW